MSKTHRIMLVSFVTLVILGVVFYAFSRNRPAEPVAGLPPLSEKPPLYELYIQDRADVVYARVYALEKGKVDYEIIHFGLIKKNLTPGAEISAAGDYKVYVPVYHDRKRERLAKKLAVLQEGGIAKVLEFPENFGTSDVFFDPEYSLAYVGFAVQPAGYNLSGRPYQIIDTKTDAVVKPFALKGSTYGYDCFGKYIYLSLDARMFGFAETPDKYLAAINRQNQEVIILNPDFPIAISLKVNPVTEEILSLVRNPDTGKSVVNIYDLSGKHLKTVDLAKRWASDIFVNHKGVSYITHKDKGWGEDLQGSTITLMDSSYAITGEMEAGLGPNEMAAADNYLFVTNSGSNTVSIIDMDSNEIAGEIAIPDARKATYIIVYKR